VAIIPLVGQQPRAPTIGGDAGTLGLDFVVGHVD
jgi:hypothetical protein